MDADISYVERLVQLVPELQNIYDEHIQDNDTLLPHVFFGEVTRFVIAKAREGRPSPVVNVLLEQLERGLKEGPTEVRELIGVSFVENLCGEKETIDFVKPSMGEELKRELATICGSG